MAYKIIISPLAQKEIENAIDYYSDLSVNTPLKFIQKIEETYSLISNNPYFRIYYKNFRGVVIKGFPFMLFYVITEDEQKVIIYSCFHTSKNPRKYPQ